MKRVKKTLMAALLLFLAVIILGIGPSFVFPRMSSLKKEAPSLTSFMKFRQKEWKKKGKRVDISKKWMPLSRISPFLVNAVLISEDDKFWTHKGFDFKGIQTALEKNLKQRTFRYGGSTITQQLAKNLYLSPSRNPIRKLREMILTWRLEKNLSKNRILELYLNVVEWGEGVFGAEAASHYYFQKSASDLTAEEAIRLAVVLPNPRRYNPLRNSRYIERRVHEILAIMEKRGIVGSNTR